MKLSDFLSNASVIEFECLDLNTLKVRIEELNQKDKKESNNNTYLVPDVNEFDLNFYAYLPIGASNSFG